MIVPTEQAIPDASDEIVDRIGEPDRQASKPRESFHRVRQLGHCERGGARTHEELAASQVDQRFNGRWKLGMERTGTSRSFALKRCKHEDLIAVEAKHRFDDAVAHCADTVVEEQVGG